MTRKLTIHKKGYTRKAYTRSDGTRVKASKVAPTTFKIKDIGAHDRGRKVIPTMKKGRMTKCAMKYGYISKGERVSDIPLSKMKKFAHDLAECVGDVNTARKMIRAQRVFRKRSPDSFKHKMDVAEKALED